MGSISIMSADADGVLVPTESRSAKINSLVRARSEKGRAIVEAEIKVRPENGQPFGITLNLEELRHIYGELMTQVLHRRSLQADSQNGVGLVEDDLFWFDEAVADLGRPDGTKSPTCDHCGKPTTALKSCGDCGGEYGVDCGGDDDVSCSEQHECQTSRRDAFHVEHRNGAETR